MRRSFSTLTVSISFSLTLFAALNFARADSSVAARDAPSRCTPPAPTVATEVERAMRRAYQPSVEKERRLALRRVGCVPPAPIERVVFETGSGHGGVVTITELRKDGDAWAVLRLDLLEGGEDRPARVTVKRGRAPAVAVEAAIARAAAALTYRLAERATAGHRDGTSLGGWSSSNDFYVRVALDGVPEREFAGYASSDAQLDYLPTETATDTLDAALEKVPLQAAPADDGARALFVAELGHARLDEEFHWWVRELYVAAAGQLGDASVVAKLRRYARSKGDDASLERTRRSAAAALAALARRHF